MFYYNKKSKVKVVHIDMCFHVSDDRHKDIGYFESLHEAYDQGYRLCKHCNPMQKQYHAERDEILQMSAKKGLSVYSGNRYISITSLASKWKITLDSEKRMILYHKNEFETPNDSMSQVLGYHLQGDVKQTSIVSYLNYIIEHDYFRMMHPVNIPKKKKESPPPRKGTRRYKSAQRRNEKNQRKQAIKNVLDLIDSLRVPSCAPTYAT